MDHVDGGVRALRAMSAAPADGRATRARVLADARRRSARIRPLPLLAATLLVMGSGGAAWTAVDRWFRPPVPVALDAPGWLVGAPAFPPSMHAARTIPRAATTPAPRLPREPAGDDAEGRTYARAHRAHFVDDAPARALAAWDEYLRAFPRGVFAPEAHYNRALCLIRVGRLRAAAAALRRFDAGGFGDYRRAEARALLAWIAERWGT